MTKALVLDQTPSGQAALKADLEAVGVHVIGAPARDSLVRTASSSAPDIVVVREPSPDAALVDVIRRLVAIVPCPVVMFTNDPDADKIAAALDAGVTEYVINGYEATRLRPVMHVALARFAQERKLKAELADVNHRFEERKLVDKAKGILMRARQLSEDEAFRVLRTASMHSHRRVGQVSQQVIDAARYADAVNRAGQLRAHSQRLVKLQALKIAGIEPAASARLITESIAHIDATIGELPKRVSASTYGDLIGAVEAGWSTLKAAVTAAPDEAHLAVIDGLAEQLLKAADQLTFNLESSGLVTTLQVINVSGRQRMLSQRFAKLDLMIAGVGGPAGPVAARGAPAAARQDSATAAMAGEAASAAADFEKTLALLNALPLSTTETRALLAASSVAWAELKDACSRTPRTPASQWAIAQASEALLDIHQRLTDEYERSMQVLMG